MCVNVFGMLQKERAIANSNVGNVRGVGSARATGSVSDVAGAGGNSVLVVLLLICVCIVLCATVLLSVVLGFLAVLYSRLVFVRPDGR